MLWIRFDEEDHRKPAPNFCLYAVSGRPVCRVDYHEDCSLALVFAASANGEAPVDLLTGFARRAGEYRKEEAKVLFAVTGQPAALAEQTAQNPQLRNLPFPLLADPDGQARRVYAGLMDESLTNPNDHLIFLLDSYGAPYAAVVGQDYDEETLHHDILKWLQYIGIQCPE